MIARSAKTLVTASEGNPVNTTLVVGMFYLAINGLYALVETLIWGDRFEHWGDAPTALAFMAYAAYCVYLCAQYHIQKLEQ